MQFRHAEILLDPELIRGLLLSLDNVLGDSSAVYEEVKMLDATSSGSGYTMLEQLWSSYWNDNDFKIGKPDIPWESTGFSPLDDRFEKKRLTAENPVYRNGFKQIHNAEVTGALHATKTGVPVGVSYPSDRYWLGYVYLNWNKNFRSVFGVDKTAYSTARFDFYDIRKDSHLKNTNKKQNILYSIVKLYFSRIAPMGILD